jgi:uncharacterized protein (DUF1501 family)
MFVHFGRRHGNCAGLNRRDFLKAGGLTMLGLGLGDLLQLRAEAAAGAGRPMNCIFIWLDGGPTHYETFDPKPDAPSEIRGEFKPIPTTVPGIQVCETLPLTAKVMAHCAVIRSLSHHDSNHGGGIHYMFTGAPTPVPVGCGASVSFHPAYGAFVAHERRSPSGLPAYIELSTGTPIRSDGPNFLGPTCAPFVISSNPKDKAFRVRDVTLPEGIDAARLDARRSLMQQLSQAQRAIEGSDDAMRGMRGYQEKAYSLVTSPAAKAAFDLNAEPDKLRDSYGRTTFGQSCLLARRLVEAGVPFTTIQFGGWDHHTVLFKSLKEKMPQFDQGFAGLIADLHTRGLLESTLVIAAGEFGRTPKINKDGGRDHWASAMSVVVAGGGVPGGQVIGATDREGNAPAERPLKPEDLAVTLYTKLGIDPRKEFHTSLGRPVPMVNGGEPIRELFG